MRELRTKKIELESALHEIQMRMVEKVQKYQVKKNCHLFWRIIKSFIDYSLIFKGRN